MEMLAAGIIERSESQYCNPLLIVENKDGRIRICLDARCLNNIIESDNESPPIIGEILQKYHGTKCMSLTDLGYGYWQIPLAVESRPYTAFLYGSQLYHFCRIPFGLKTAGSGFIRALNLALGNEFDSFLTCYIDDLLITSASFDDHLHHLDLVFRKLQAENFTLRLDKSYFFRRQVKFLGFILSVDGIRPNPSKLEKIRQFAEPKNRKELQQIIGVCTYYRQFSVYHSNLIDPFRNLLKSKGTWIWTPAHSQAFVALKNAFADSITLHHVLQDVPFKLQTDASDRGISGILYQTDSEGYHRIVSLVSRCLNAAEINYNTTEKELLAIVYSIYKCRIYLARSTFYVITDHHALTFLSTTLFHTSRLVRWSIYLQQYSIIVEHCKGCDNVVADFFSRNPAGKFEPEHDPHRLSIALLTSDVEFSRKGDQRPFNNLYKLTRKYDDLPVDIRHDLDRIRDLQQSDPHIVDIVARIEGYHDGTRYRLFRGVLFHSKNLQSSGYSRLWWRLVIPEVLQRRLIEFTHEKLAHPGVAKTLAYLGTHFFWNTMNRDVKKCVLGCDLCQRVKYISQSMEGEYHMVPASKPTELVTVDFFGPLPRSLGGVEYIFVVLDAHSKYVKLYPIKWATTQIALKKILIQYIPEMGKPQSILSDNGMQFTSHNWKSRLHQEGIRVIFSSIRHPQSNPTERVMRELGRLFRTLCSENYTKWAYCISRIEAVLNVTTHSSTGFSPHELHFGKRAIDQIDELITFPPGIELTHCEKSAIAESQMRIFFEYRKRSEKSVSKVSLEVGDLVLLRVPFQSRASDRVTSKFFHLYQGPYRIGKVVGNNALLLVDPSDPTIVKNVYNRCSLKKYKSPVSHAVSPTR